MTDQDILMAINELYGCDFTDLCIAKVFMEEIRDKSEELAPGCYRTPQAPPAE